MQLAKDRGPDTATECIAYLINDYKNDIDNYG